MAVTEFKHGEEEEEEVIEDIELFHVIEDTSNIDSSIQHENIGPIITKIRKIVVIFRRSPTKNDILQKYVKDEFKKELTLILDTKTRWSSLLIMLERIYEIKNCVRKSLIDIKSDIDLSENDLNIVSHIITALQPIKVAVEALCSSDTNLYVADLTLKFMLDELSNQNNFLSNELKQDLIFQINERRTVYSDIYSYLHEPGTTSNNENNYGVFDTTSKVAMEKTMVEIIQQFLKNDPETTEAEVLEVYETESIIESTVPSVATTSSQAMSMKERLNLVIEKKMKTIAHEEISDPKTSSGLLNIVRKEMAYFKEQNIKGKYLNKLQKYISTVRPTSVDSERAFFRSKFNWHKVQIKSERRNIKCNVFLLFSVYMSSIFNLLIKNR